MRSIKRLVICTGVFGILLGFCLQARAIPNLQIYIPGATYDPQTETWVIYSNEYDLWVIGAHLDVYDVKFAAAVPTNENGSIDVRWLDPSVADYGGGGVVDLTFLDPDLGPDSNRLDYQDYRDTYNSPPDPDTYGFDSDSTPQMGDGSHVPPHGVFPTDFYEYYIGDFDTSQLVQNYIPGPEWGDTAWGQTKKFHISVTDYTWVDMMAYDHVILGNNHAQYKFTPLSHDGASAVPEPCTMVLLGTGLIGMACVGRRKISRR